MVSCSPISSSFSWFSIYSAIRTATLEFFLRLLVSLGRILSADTLAQTQYDICNSILCALNYWCHSFPLSGLLLVYKLQLADRIFILPEGVFSPQLFNSYRTTRLTRGFGIQKTAGDDSASPAAHLFCFCLRSSVLYLMACRVQTLHQVVSRRKKV